MANWNYTEAPRCKYGAMLCITCGKEILVGPYRYRTNKNEEYLVEHRACSESDTFWKRDDRRQAIFLEVLQQRLEAYINFKTRWDTDSLDEDIERLTTTIQNLT